MRRIAIALIENAGRPYETIDCKEIKVGTFMKLIHIC